MLELTTNDGTLALPASPAVTGPRSPESP